MLSYINKHSCASIYITDIFIHTFFDKTDIFILLLFKFFWSRPYSHGLGSNGKALPREI